VREKQRIFYEGHDLLSRVLKISLIFLLFIGSTLCIALNASAQLTILSYSPAATETPSGSHYYTLNGPIPYDAVALAWNFSKGLDGKFVENINNIRVEEKGSSTEIKFDNSTGVSTPTATGGLIIKNADFTYTKEGSGTDPIQIRELALKPTTVAFEPDKTYVVTVYDDLNGNIFQANNGSVLDATYSFEFATFESGNMIIKAYSPAATETAAGSHYYRINDPTPHETTAFSWDFSQDMDAPFARNMYNITVKEKGSDTEVNFDTSEGTKTAPLPGSSDTGSIMIENADYTYIKEDGVRRLRLEPRTVSFLPNKTYVITLYPEYWFNAFQSNTGNLLDAVYSFEFATETVGVVSLASFAATPRSRKVVLTWTTDSEINTEAFSVLRADSPEGPFATISDVLIMAKGSATKKASYAFVDKPLRNRRTYYYRLEAIDTNGDRQVLESASAQPRLLYLLMPPQ
jgi:hypothetical protein